MSERRDLRAGGVLRSVLASILSLAIGGVLAFATLEGFLRVRDWPTPGLYVDGRGPLPLVLPSAEGSAWRNYKGDAELRHWSYRVPVRLNRHGFIEREPEPKPRGAWRIGLFGDSFAAGQGVESVERFGNLWAEALRDRFGREVEVYNFGSAWCGSAQNAAFLERHGAEYELDELVLAVFSGNELTDNERFESYSKRSEEERRALDAARGKGSIRSWLRDHSRAAGFLWITFARMFAGTEQHYLTPQSVESLWPLTERALERFASAAGGRPMTLWYLPSRPEWDDAAWEWVRAEAGLADDDRDVLRERMQAWAERRGVAFVDLTSSLSGKDPDEVTIALDGHLNAEGNLGAAALLAADPRASHLQREARQGSSAQQGRDG